MSSKWNAAGLIVATIVLAISQLSCAPTKPTKLNIPRGYVSTLRLQKNGQNLSFGPFVGYYFKPETPSNLRKLHFMCFNERSFYTLNVQENQKLFEGTAILTTLPDLSIPLPQSSRINPVFFDEAPAEWIGSRPTPTNEFLHFHSCHTASGPVLTGYWLKHIAVTNFLYDMGGRVKADSPLYHNVDSGLDTSFARIIEFDAGPK